VCVLLLAAATPVSSATVSNPATNALMSNTFRSEGRLVNSDFDPLSIVLSNNSQRLLEVFGYDTASLPSAMTMLEDVDGIHLTARRAMNASVNAFRRSVAGGTAQVASDRERRQLLSGNQEDTRPCTTPSGENGYCLDLADCPDLVLDIGNLRRSVCFKSLFVPGVCCPKSGMRIDEHTTRRTTTTTTRRPPPRPTRRPLVTTPAPPPPVFPASHHPNARFRCGEAQVPQQRIVGGQYSPAGKWPWMAAVFLHGPAKTEFWCGASLVSSKFILTAAHCTKDPNGKTFSPQQFTVRLGDHNILSPVDDHLVSPRTYRVNKIIGHPEFRARGFYNDIALLKLDTEVLFNDFIIPVCLPPPDLVQRAEANINHIEGLSPTVLGYGSTNYDGAESATLQEVKLPVWSNEDCDRAYLQPIEDIFLCAGYPEGGKDACQGDSGGPLLLYAPTRQWMQVGIVSFGNRCAEPGYPGVYTRLTNFMTWIHNTMLAHNK